MKNSSSRRRWILPNLEQVHALARRGVDESDIVRSLGIDSVMLDRKRKALKAFKNAMETGRAQGILDVANALYEGALSGDTDAQIFYLKTVGGWRESDIQVRTDAEEKLERINKVREETLNILSALTPEEIEQYLNLLDTGRMRFEKGIKPKGKRKELPPSIAHLEVENDPRDEKGGETQS